MRVEGCIQGRPCVGETRSGDVGLIHAVEAVTWVLLIDALGHGNEAADAADAALDEARGFAAALTVEAALEALHVRLKGSRGAAAALLRFDPERVSVGGVGNVEVRTLSGGSIPYVPGRGVLGSRLPRLRTLELEPTEPGQVLLFTDGIERQAPLSSLARLGGEQMCARLVAEHSLERDDATVIHVGYWPR